VIERTLILRSGAFAASRRMRDVLHSWFETRGIAALLTMRIIKREGSCP
jgi:hypothetical protein